MLNDVLRTIANDQPLIDALKDAFRQEFDKPVDTNRNDAELGQMVRARIEGMKAVEEVFRKVSQMKTPEKKPTEGNPAR